MIKRKIIRNDFIIFLNVCSYLLIQMILMNIQEVKYLIENKAYTI